MGGKARKPGPGVVRPRSKSNEALLKFFILGNEALLKWWRITEKAKRNEEREREIDDGFCISFLSLFHFKARHPTKVSQLHDHQESLPRHPSSKSPPPPPLICPHFCPIHFNQFLLHPHRINPEIQFVVSIWGHFWIVPQRDFQNVFWLFNPFYVLANASAIHFSKAGQHF